MSENIKFGGRFASGVEVSDVTRRPFRASAVIGAVKDFIESEFPACAEVNADISCDEAIMISADYMALFWASLLRSVFGNAFLSIDIKTSEDGLTMSVSTDKPFSVSESEINRLIRIARNAGMDVTNSQKLFSAQIKFVSKKEYSVYAINVSTDKKIIISKLCEMFYGK